MRILILSNTPWANDNSFGNSFSNIFGGMKNVEFANIFCRYGAPNNNIVNRYFQITEKMLLKNLRNSSSPPGKEIFAWHGNADKLDTKQQNGFDYVRKKRFLFYFWLRDLFWGIGRWKSKELKNYIDDFKPDLIFQPLYYSNYLSDIALFLKQYTGVPMVCYVSDDVYTLRQYHLSPFYWIDRLIKRRKVKKVVDQCEHIYVISDIQKQEYEKCFKKECRILTKGADFSGEPPFKGKLNDPLKFVYTGNIGSGRWKSLTEIGKALSKINKDNVKAQLFIYSLTPMTNKMSQALNIPNSVCLMGGVSADKISNIQSDADILVHAEPTDLKGRLQVRHSFSTKIIDYFCAARCIFAVGTPDVASIDYLTKNDSAVIAVNKKEIEDKLRSLIDNKSLISEYGKKAWDCGKRNHQIDIIQSKLYEDLNALAKGEKL